jgi:hypothetical protein
MAACPGGFINLQNFSADVLDSLLDQTYHHHNISAGTSHA